MLKLIAGKYALTVANEPTFNQGSTDNLQIFNFAHHLGPDSYVSSRHAVRVTDTDGSVTSCILTAGGGASGIHDDTAIIVDSTCFIAVGPFIASLTIPGLDLNWATQTDDATCFGVHNSPNHNCLISHGEMMIARVTLDGTIGWQAGGADIFTNDCQLDGDAVHVTDFNDREYTFDITTGREIAA